jgi:hypothetical protein
MLSNLGMWTNFEKCCHILTNVGIILQIWAPIDKTGQILRKCVKFGKMCENLFSVRKFRHIGKIGKIMCIKFGQLHNVWGL